MLVGIGIGVRRGCRGELGRTIGDATRDDRMRGRVAWPVPCVHVREERLAEQRDDGDESRDGLPSAAVGTGDHVSTTEGVAAYQGRHAVATNATPRNGAGDAGAAM